MPYPDSHESDPGVAFSGSDEFKQFRFIIGS